MMAIRLTVVRVIYSGAFLAAWTIGHRSISAEPADFQPMADLPPLLEFADGTPAASIEDWQRRREEIRSLLMQHFTGSPPPEAPTIVSARVASRCEGADGALRKRIEITLATPRLRSFEIALWLPPGEEPFPLLLTQPRDYQIPWAEMALARGYAVALYPGVDSHHREPDYPGYHSVWETFREEYPQATWTEIITKAWLASRTLDYLLGPEQGHRFAKGQVGIIGFSRYGKQSLIAAAFDERITAVVARSPGSPGSSPYRFTSRETFAEAPADFPGEWFLPSLREFTGREHELPIDAHGWYALIAPRRCLIHTAHNDGSEPTFAVERAYLAGRDVYRRLGAAEHFRIHYRPGQHGPITESQRQENLDWFDLAFERGEIRPDAFPEEFLHAFDWEAWKADQLPADLAMPAAGMPGETATAVLRRRVGWMLGEPPEEFPGDGIYTLLTAEESAMMTHDRWAVPGVTRLPVSFGENVRGNLYFDPSHEGRRPVVIWLHPYSYHSGYNEGYGVEGTTVYHRLAAEGYAVLAYDQCGFGLRLLEGREFYTAHPHWSRLGRMVYDVQRAVDFVVEGEGRMADLPDTDLPQFDPEQIYLLGYALGGIVALHAAALDERIAGVASFAGFAPWRSDTDVRTTGGVRRLAEWHALLPKLALFEGCEERIPYDFGDLLRQIAPRRCLIVAPQQDRFHDVRKVRQCLEHASDAWEKSTGGLTTIFPDDHNRFQVEQHRLFLRWMGER